ncbi:IPT/TIG domain-containing protein [bacterium]|nr:IPT/TIG domain-containing protein [bacterium]
MRLFRLFLLLLLPVLIISCEDDSVSSPIPVQKSILSIVPDSAYAGDTVSILGSGFGSSGENIKVKIGEKDAVVLSVSDSVIQVVCPLQKVAETGVSVSFDGEEVENDLVFYPKWYYFMYPENGKYRIEIKSTNITLEREGIIAITGPRPDSIITYFVSANTQYTNDSRFLDTDCSFYRFDDEDSLTFRFEDGKHAPYIKEGFLKIDTLNQVIKLLRISDRESSSSTGRWANHVNLGNLTYHYKTEFTYGAELKGEEEISKYVHFGDNGMYYYDGPQKLEDGELFSHSYRTTGMVLNETSEISVIFTNMQ